VSRKSLQINNLRLMLF